MRSTTSYCSKRHEMAALVFATLVGLAACTDPVPGPMPGSGQSSVRFGATVTTTDMTVSSAIPDSANQDTTLDVTINGSGFVAGTNANWALSGIQDPTQVRTNSTKYVSSRKIVANITISSTAAVLKWDIVVSAAGTKGGIGTELFAIKAKRITTDTKANLVWNDTVNVGAPGAAPVWESALITGDYRKLDGAPLSNGKSGEFQYNFCGSDSYMQNSTMSFPDAALNFDPDHLYDPASMDAVCRGKRYYQFYFAGRGSAPLQFGPQHYALKLGTLAVGDTMLEEVHFGIQQTNCNALHFNDIYAPATNARVTRLTDTLTAYGPTRRWRVQSQGTHRAMCTLFTNKGPKPTGVTYYLPFAFVVTEVHAPYPHFP